MDAHGGEGLSVGARIAIGVSVPVVVLAFTLTLVVFLRRRMKHRQSSPVLEPEQEHTNFVELQSSSALKPTELDSDRPPATMQNESNIHAVPMELDSQVLHINVHEKDAAVFTELDSNTAPPQ